MTKIVFRADASIQIGTGHVMRCLALAQQLKNRGHECIFITREHPGNLIQKIEDDGFNVRVLPQPESVKGEDFTGTSHAEWLGVSWQQDAEETIRVLKGRKPEWVIIDHYAIDAKWENLIRPFVGRLAVIDDLADRVHDCDLLIDQTYCRALEDYQPLVPEPCELVVGSKYALLRPEFLQWRKLSLQRRERPQIQSILVTMGGSDKDNYTGRVLKVLNDVQLNSDIVITVVLGSNAPFLDEVKGYASKLKINARIKVDVRHMAKLMAYSDLCIGAAGSTTWERCCMGLPTLQLVTAVNQTFIAEQLAKAGAVVMVGSTRMEEELRVALSDTGPDQLAYLSSRARKITDGNGAMRIAKLLTRPEMIA